MRKFFAMFFLAALTTGCNNNSIEKANDLLNKRTNLNLGQIETLDSINDYPESFEYTIKAMNTSEEADTLLKSKIAMLTELQKTADENELQQQAEKAREDIINLVKVAEQYSNKAALYLLKSEAKKANKQFLGWSYKSKNDSCTYVVYFNADVSKILAIGKK